MSSELPFVSAIMPTRGRAQWAMEAVEMFLRQSWPAKELVIVDDRMEPSFPLGLRRDSVVYLVAPRFPVGAKRNMAISRSSGDVIVHWDSDDLYAPDRIEHQVNLLIEKNVELVGYHDMWFIDPEQGGSWIYRGSRDYTIGVSMCYWRSTWEKYRFDSVDVGEDENFYRKHKRFACPAEDRIIARVHSGNTCDKRPEIVKHPDKWERIA